MRVKRALAVLMALGFVISLNSAGYKTSAAGIGNDEQQISYQDLMAANNRDILFSRHKNWTADLSIIKCEYFDIIADLYGYNGFTVYGEPDFLYYEMEYRDSDGEPYFADELYFKDGSCSVERSKGEVNYHYVWYVMREDEIEDNCFDICEINPISAGDETITSSRVNEDGALIVTTKAPFEHDMDIMPSGWKDGTTETDYYLNKDNLELQKLDTKILTDKGPVDYLTQTCTYDVAEPEGCAELRAFYEKVRNTEPETPRKVTIVYNPGEEDEETFSIIADIDYYVDIELRNGYKLYEDAEGKIPGKDIYEKTDHTLYAIRDKK